MRYTFARNEKKFLITVEQRDRLLEMVAGHIRPDEWGRSTVRSLYCDTPSRMMIRHSLEHPAYKEKIRIRTYGHAGPDDDVFMELKQKVNGVTYKRRATMPFRRAIGFVHGTEAPNTQIEREIAATIARYASEGGLVPATLIACERQAYFATDDNTVRLTFDEDIRWSDAGMSFESSPSATRRILDSDLVLLEVKCGEAMPLWLVKAMSALDMRPTGFSKYGLAWKHEMILRGMTTASDGLAPAIAHARAGNVAKARRDRPVPPVARREERRTTRRTSMLQENAGLIRNLRASA